MRHDRIDPKIENGGRLADRVGDRMSRPVETIRQDAPARAAWALMRRRGIRHLPVVDAGRRLVGIVTDRDLRQLVFDPAIRARLVGRSRHHVAVEAVMTRGVITTRPEASILEAARLMHERKIGALLVLDGDRLAGIFTESDAVATLVDTLGTLSVPPALRWAISPPRRTA